MSDARNVMFSMTQAATPLYGPGPDKAWTYTDRAGHRHAYDAGYPTLERRSEHIDCGDPECWSGGYCDGYDNEYYVCPRCGERITPATVMTTYYVAGRANYTIDGMPVDGAEYRRRAAEALAACKETP